MIIIVDEVRNVFFQKLPKKAPGADSFGVECFRMFMLDDAFVDFLCGLCNDVCEMKKEHCGKMCEC